MFEEKSLLSERHNIVIYFKKRFKEENKDTILILHGWGGSSDSWIKVGDLLFQNGYNVLVPDLPGFGKTNLNKVFLLDDYAEIIEEFVNYLSLDDIILWGHSNGGAISVKLSIRNNLKIKKLILNNSAGIRNDITRSLKRKIINSIISIFPESLRIKLKSSKLRTIFYKIIGGQDYINALKNPFLKETYLNMIKSDLSCEFEKIKNDTLIIWGKLDTYTPLSDGLFMKDKIKNSKMFIFDDERHGIHLKSPEKLVSIFLENVN